MLETTSGLSDDPYWPSMQCYGAEHLGYVAHIYNKDVYKSASCVSVSAVQLQQLLSGCMALCT